MSDQVSRTKSIPLLDPGIHTAICGRFQTDGGRVVGFKLPEGRTKRVLFHACDVQKSILSLGCLAQQGYWNELCADTVTLTQYSQTQLHMEERVLCHRDADGALDVAQELQMPIGPQALDDEEEPMPSPSCKTQRSNRAGSAQSDTFPESALVQSVRRISRTRLSTTRTVENRRSGAITSF